MQESTQCLLDKRYRKLVRRFDALWDRSSPDAEAEMDRLLRALRHLEACLARNALE